MNPEADLTELAAQVADGLPIDWARAESASTSPADLQLLQRLRLVERLAQLHANLPSIDSASQHESVLHPTTGHANYEPDAPIAWGPLTIVEKIGRGTFGDVYRARDPKLDRPVALKLLRRRERNGEALEQAVIEEGRLMARVRHPNVVTIYGAERIDGRVGLWMELVDGQTLEQELSERGPFAAEDVVRIGIDVSRALAAVHRAGLLHRDLKAQNVMRDRDGRVLLTDFGAGRELTQDAMSGGHELAGTPLYLAPEVLTGAAASPASDVYSLGVLLYHLATGSFPVGGRSLRDLRDGHAHGERAVLRESRPDLPRALIAIVDRALHADSAGRYQTVEELEAALTLTSTRGQRRRNALVASGLAIAAIVVTALGLTWRGRAAAPRTQAFDSMTGATTSQASTTAAALPVSAEPSVTLPAESLKFKSRDWVLIAQFENKTRNALLDGTLEGALERDLANSAFVNVAPRARIEDVLQLMRKPIDAVVDARLGREVALRDGGVRALLTGRVQTVGPSYVLTAEIRNPADGAVVSSLEEDAATPQALLEAVRRVAFRVREALGEMIATIRASEAALERVTTPSLHALQLYSQASALMHGDGWNNAAAEPLLKQAIAEDPTFASAHILLAWATANQRRNPEEFMPHATHALELAESTSDVERYFITASYYDLRSGRWSGRVVSEEDFQQAIRTYQALMQIKPDHYWAVSNLAHAYTLVGKEPEAGKWQVRYAEVRSSGVSANIDVAEYFMRRGDVSRALRYCRRARELHGSLERCAGAELWAAYNVSGVLQRAAEFERQPEWSHLAVAQYVALGRFGDAERVVRTLPTTANSGWHNQSLQTSLMWTSRVWLGDPRALALRKRQVASYWVGDPANVPMPVIAPPLYPLLVSGYIREGNVELARQIVAKATALDAARQPARTGDNLTYFLTRNDLIQYEGAIAVADGRLDAATRAFQTAKAAGVWAAESLRMSSLLASGWVGQGNAPRAIKVLEEATNDKATLALAGFDELRGGPAHWIAVRNELAELYYATGRLKEAKAIDRELLKLLAFADEDHPVLLKLRARN